MWWNAEYWLKSLNFFVRKTLKQIHSRNSQLIFPNNQYCLKIEFVLFNFKFFMKFWQWNFLTNPWLILLIHDQKFIWICFIIVTHQRRIYNRRVWNWQTVVQKQWCCNQACYHLDQQKQSITNHTEILDTCCVPKQCSNDKIIDLFTCGSKVRALDGFLSIITAVEANSRFGFPFVLKKLVECS